MFVIVKISDVIKVHPQLWDQKYHLALIEEIDRKYANKVVVDVGLCVSVYDLLAVDDSYIHPSDGASHTQVVFRMIVFRPFIGEVITGKIISCNKDHIRVSIDFCQDILIPSHALQQPAKFDETQRLWFWKYSDDENFYLDLFETIKLRITHVNYTKVTKTETGVQATTTESSPIDAAANASTKTKAMKTQAMQLVDDARSSMSRRRSSSVDLSEADPRPSALQIMGTINEDGLGLCSWWES